MTSFKFFRSQRKAVANARFIILSEFISVDVGGGGVIVVINILYCLLVCIFFTHFLSPSFSPFLLTFGS